VTGGLPPGAADRGAAVRPSGDGDHGRSADARRRAEIAANHAAVQARIGAACVAAGRHRADVHLVAVTKTFPLTDVEHLAGIGQRDFAESREQEAAPKARARPDLAWHFVGSIQGNQARAIGTWADVVHSYDRSGLAAGLARGADEAGRPAPDVLVQVSLDGDPARGGLAPAEVGPAADAAAAAGLPVRGVMAVAPLGTDPARAFARLREVAEVLRATHEGAVWISAGMSGDLEAAIAEGATHVRIGAALLGRRPAPSG
jgi:pyridoxal phosphate enzyme (YggS family)